MLHQYELMPRWVPNSIALISRTSSEVELFCLFFVPCKGPLSAKCTVTLWGRSGFCFGAFLLINLYDFVSHSDISTTQPTKRCFRNSPWFPDILPMTDNAHRTLRFLIGQILSSNWYWSADNCVWVSSEGAIQTFTDSAII